MVCGGGWPATATAARFIASLELVLLVETPAGASEVTVTAQGGFLRGLPDTAAGWGGAAWIGLANANDTASQFRAELADLRVLGFSQSADVARAVLFVAGLGEKVGVHLIGSTSAGRAA